MANAFFPYLITSIRDTLKEMVFENNLERNILTVSDTATGVVSDGAISETYHECGSKNTSLQYILIIS